MDPVRDPVFLKVVFISVSKVGLSLLLSMVAPTGGVPVINTGV